MKEVTTMTASGFYDASGRKRRCGKQSTILLKPTQGQVPLKQGRMMQMEMNHIKIIMGSSLWLTWRPLIKHMGSKTMCEQFRVVIYPKQPHCGEIHNSRG